MKRGWPDQLIRRKPLESLRLCDVDEAHFLPEKNILGWGLKRVHREAGLPGLGLLFPLNTSRILDPALIPSAHLIAGPW